MKLFIEREQRQEELDFEGTAAELMTKVGVNPETVVITKNGTVVTEDEKLGADDEVKLISVVSGG